MGSLPSPSSARGSKASASASTFFLIAMIVKQYSYIKIKKLFSVIKNILSLVSCNPLYLSVDNIPPYESSVLERAQGTDVLSYRHISRVY